jgi:peptidoglycan/LPS O-acetylase OafA/YrhL
LSYVPGLDALRAIAIFLVLWFHFSGLGFGWVGVQIFFVLSGYLITAILLREREQPLASYLKRFFIRRSLRIFPLYYCFLGLATASYLVFGAPRALESYWPFLYTYTFNLRPLFGIQENDVLLHDPFFPLWSLSVEEQFYLVWPWIVFALSPQRFRWFLVGLIVATPALRWLIVQLSFMMGKDEEFSRVFLYYFTPCQADAFAWGAILNFVPRVSAQRARIFFLFMLAVVVAVGLWHQGFLQSQGQRTDFLALGYPLHMFDNYQYVWGYSLWNLFSASLVFLFLVSREPRATIGWRGLKRMGRVSYGMYVLHTVVLIPFALWVLSPQMTIAEFLLAFLGYTAVVWGAAELSFRLFEERFLKLKDKWS